MADMNTIINGILNKESGDDAWNVVNVNVFGYVEMQNKWGHVTETQFKSSLHWMLMKYLLLNPGRTVSDSEIYGMVWPERNSEQDDTAARVRLRRMREALRPLKLNDAKEFLLYSNGAFKLNDKYIIRKNDAKLLQLLEKIKKCPVDDITGLNLCCEALEIYKGLFMENTVDVSWLEPYRAYYYKVFVELAEATMERTVALNDGRAMDMLCQRSILIAPEEEDLHKSIISFLFDHSMDLDLVRHVTQLAHVGGEGATWLPVQQ